MKPAGGSFDGVELPNRGAVQEEDSERRRGSQQGGFDSYSGTVLAILVLLFFGFVVYLFASNWGGKSDSAPAQDTCKSYECKDGFVLKGEPEKIKGTMTDETCCEAKTAEQAKTADTVPQEDATKENGGTDEKPAAEKEAAEKAAADKAAAEKAAADKEAAEKEAEKNKNENGNAEEDHGHTDEQKKKPEEAEENKNENGNAEEEKEEGKDKENVPEKKEEEKGKEADQEKEKKSKETTPEVVDPEKEKNLPLGTQCWVFGPDGHNEKSQKERDERCGEGLICARYTHDQRQFLGMVTTLGKADWRKECEFRGWGDDNCNSIGGKDKFRCSTDPGKKEVKKCNVVDGSNFTAEPCGCGTDICEKDEYCIIDHAGKNAEEKGSPCVAMCKETNGMKQTANKCMCSKPEHICEVNEVCFIRLTKRTPTSRTDTTISCEPAPQSEPPKESEQAEDDDSKDPAKADPQPPPSNADTPILLVGGHRR